MNEIGLKKSALDTPCLWVDLEALERNITYLAGRFKAAGVNWRPHTKGLKVPAIAHQALRAGAMGVTCAKLSEAEVMAAAGLNDILIANQIVGPQKIARLVNLCRQAAVKVAVDNEANIVALGQAAQAKGVEIGILVEVNVGLNRAGVQPGTPALTLSQKVHQTPGLHYLGLMGWEGHATEVADWAARRTVIEKAMRLLTDTVQLCREAGLPVSIVSSGGSLTYPVTAAWPGITEIQAGGAIFGDVTYRDGGAGTTPALFAQTMVTSRPAPDRIIFDSGFKSLPTWIQMPEPVGLTGVKSISASAEHLTVTLENPNQTVQIGDHFDFIVGYGDSTVFLHDDLYGIRDDAVEVVWAIQGRGKFQ